MREIKDLEIGEIIETSISSHTLVFSVNEKEDYAVLVAPERDHKYILAKGLEYNLKKEIYEWDFGTYAKNLEELVPSLINTKETVKSVMEDLLENHYIDTFKSIITIETGIDDEELLDRVYEHYLDFDTPNFLDDDILDLIDKEKENMEAEREAIETELESEFDQELIDVHYEEIAEKFLNDKNMFMNSVKHLPNRLQDDKELVLKAVNSNRMVIQFASDDLRNDPEIAKTAIKDNYKAMDYISDRLKEDKVFVINAAKENALTFEFADPKLKSDKSFIENLLKNGVKPVVMEFASLNIRNDKNLIKRFAKINEDVLKHVEPEMKNKIELEKKNSLEK